MKVEQRFCDRERPWAGWHCADRARPLFMICRPQDGQPHDPGNGQMVAFAAATRAQVHAAYEAALAHGGSDEGAPGLRPQYHAEILRRLLPRPGRQQGGRGVSRAGVTDPMA